MPISAGRKNIAIYELTPDGHKFIKAIQFDGDLKEDGNEDKLAPKIEAIKDCAILYVAAIGGSAAARVVANKIHPVKVDEPDDIDETLGKLKDVLNGHPAALAAQGDYQGPGKTFDFEDEWFNP